jgi:hypothetical protein
MDAVRTLTKLGMHRRGFGITPKLTLPPAQQLRSLGEILVHQHSMHFERILEASGSNSA